MIPIISRLMLTVSLLLTLTACGGGGGGDGTSSATPLTFTSLTITGTASTASTVSAHGVADADGTSDKTWNVPVPLDGARLPIYRDGDPYETTVTATGSPGGNVSLTIGIHP